jgi:hypothetical protein
MSDDEEEYVYSDTEENYGADDADVGGASACVETCVCGGKELNRPRAGSVETLPPPLPAGNDTRSRGP